MYGSATAQITITGHVMIVNNDTQDLPSDAVYISKDTYIYSFSPAPDHQVKPKRKSLTRFFVDHKIKNHPKPVIHNKVSQIVRYHYSLTDDHKMLFSSSSSKICCAGSNTDHQKKGIPFRLTEDSSAETYRGLSLKLLTKTVQCKQKYSDKHYRTRPPPYLPEYQSLKYKV